MIARWGVEEKKWSKEEKDKVERVGMMAAERQKGMNGQRKRERERDRESTRG